MQITFRTDASHIIGTGHVMRCLTLADTLRNNDAEIIFICREHNGNLCDLIENRGFLVHRLPCISEGFIPDASPSHAVWLGTPWEEDAAQTLAIIKDSGIKPNWLIVDHYAIDYRWEQALRPFVKRIFVFDDLADRSHECDVLLDQNLVPEMHTRYNSKIPDNCTLLLGPKYAVLQPIYPKLHDHISPRKAPIKRILVSFGGYDNDNLTSRALRAILNLNRTDIEIDIVISENSSFITEIRKLVAEHPNIHLYSALPTLAQLMAKADLAIGAAGTTNWERLCLGLPAIVITLADNQQVVANYLHRKKLIKYIGHKDQVDEQSIITSIHYSMHKISLHDWSSKCLEICDGKGMYRIVEFIINNQNNNGNISSIE